MSPREQEDDSSKEKTTQMNGGNSDTSLSYANEAAPTVTPRCVKDRIPPDIACLKGSKSSAGVYEYRIGPNSLSSPAYTTLFTLPSAEELLRKSTIYLKNWLLVVRTTRESYTSMLLCDCLDQPSLTSLDWTYPKTSIYFLGVSCFT